MCVLCLFSTYVKAIKCQALYRVLLLHLVLLYCTSSVQEEPCLFVQVVLQKKGFSPTVLHTFPSCV